MKTTTRAGIALAVGTALAVGPAFAAQGASTAITNGLFEADPAGSSSITGWTSMNQAIDLGVTSIAGCRTVDTSDYTNLRDYLDEAEAVWNVQSAPVPGQPDSWFYVSDVITGERVTVLGSPLVWDDMDGWFYLEIAAEPVSSPAYSLSSVTTDPPAEPAPEVTEDPTPSDEPTAEPTPEPAEPQPAPSDAPTEEPAPEQVPENAPSNDTTPREQLSPATSGPTYLIEWDWSTEQQEEFEFLEEQAPDPTTRGDNPAFAALDEEAYSVRVVAEGTDGPIDSEGDQEDPIENLGRDGTVLELYSDLGGNADGYVIHGPAVFSAPFTVGAGRQVSLDWKAVNESDDFHVFGYLLNVTTCAQTEVIDATGEEQDWTTTSVNIPAAGTYRFVFASGSYDQSWGGAAGAFLYIDNIVQTPVFSSPGVDLALAAGVGEYLPGSDVQVTGSGLVPESDYDLVLRSTPVTVTQGTADGDGRFFDVVPLPNDISPGPHTITLTGQGPSGPLTMVAYITVGTDGTLQYLSFDGPQAALAETGAAESAGLLALALLLVVTGAAAFELERRRRSPFSTVYVR